MFASALLANVSGILRIRRESGFGSQGAIPAKAGRLSPAENGDDAHPLLGGGLDAFSSGSGRDGRVAGFLADGNKISLFLENIVVDFEILRIMRFACAWFAAHWAESLLLLFREEVGV